MVGIDASILEFYSDRQVCHRVVHKLLTQGRQLITLGILKG